MLGNGKMTGKDKLSAAEKEAWRARFYEAYKVNDRDFVRSAEEIKTIKRYLDDAYWHELLVTCGSEQAIRLIGAASSPVASPACGPWAPVATAPASLPSGSVSSRRTRPIPSLTPYWTPDAHTPR